MHPVCDPHCTAEEVELIPSPTLTIKVYLWLLVDREEESDVGFRRRPIFPGKETHLGEV